MSMLRRRQLAWVLLFTLVLAALAPGVSRALAFAQGSLAPWSVVCSAPSSGPGMPALPAEQAAHLLEHCAWCHLHTDQLALPPSQAMALPLLVLQQAVPTLFLQAPRPLPAWAAQQARAPPQQT